MAWRCGSVSRSLISNARTSSIRSSIPRLRPSPPPIHAPPRVHSLPSLFSRNLGALACAQSLMPLHSVVADSRLTSHVSVEVRACCELSQGT